MIKLNKILCSLLGCRWKQTERKHSTKTSVTTTPKIGLRTTIKSSSVVNWECTRCGKTDTCEGDTSYDLGDSIIGGTHSGW
jgi:hypothetical protein